MNSATDLQSFACLVESLSPWLDQLVIIGGWACRLYRFHPVAAVVNYPPLITLDTDVALPGELKLGEQNIRERLFVNGFHEEFLGDQHPPATHYRLGDASSGFYAEFLTPLVGGEYDRRGARKATVTIGGVISQRLRHLDLLLAAPWQVEIDATSGFPTAKKRRIQIPNPVSFIVQKLLIHSRRPHEDQAKDILYIHDAVEMFSAHLAELNEIWRTVIRPVLNSRSIRSIERAHDDLFGQVNDITRDSTQMAIGRTLSAEFLREVCNVGLSQLFR